MTTATRKRKSRAKTPSIVDTLDAIVNEGTKTSGMIPKPVVEQIETIDVNGKAVTEGDIVLKRPFKLDIGHAMLAYLSENVPSLASALQTSREIYLGDVRVECGSYEVFQLLKCLPELINSVTTELPGNGGRRLERFAFKRSMGRIVRQVSRLV